MDTFQPYLPKRIYFKPTDTMDPNNIKKEEEKTAKEQEQHNKQDIDNENEREEEEFVDEFIK